MTPSIFRASLAWFAHLSLRRIITSNRFIPEVDGFRFLAIIIVIISHIFVQCVSLVPTGFFSGLFVGAFLDGRHGVYLFFTISGFILALPFARHHLEGSKPIALGSYFKRRITRLEPPYVLAMLLRAPALLFLKKAAVVSVGIHLLASLFYVHNAIFAEYSTINPPAWSLEVEIQFYLLTPLLTSIFRIRSPALRRSVIVIVMIVSAVCSMAFIGRTGRMSLTLLNYFQYFAAGFLLCDLYLSKVHLSLPPLIWDAIGLLALGWILVSSNPLYPILLPFATICLYMAGFFGRFVRGFFSVPAVSIIGGMCYSIYLTHTAVLSVITLLLDHIPMASWPQAVQMTFIFTLCFSTILAIGTLFFVLIERPCMNPAWPQQLSAWLFRRSHKTPATS
ncbi:acyltransferase family protein [Granulicella arctica]|uniref:acyltransferase family protein n=1 Tax=Granulicella arctica TaxID=940613 RepID=UPI0021E05E43|nr:acyltransferase [Granulicella arctica]